MKVVVFGGMGYVGSWMVPHLLADGHEVTVFDIGWFGDAFLPRDNGRLRMVTADVRDIDRVRHELRGAEAVIHMACVSNDPSCQLDEGLSRSINIDAFEPVVVAAKVAGVRRFIYASSSSVYGVSEAPDVREDHPTLPLTVYNESKRECEKLLLPHASPEFECVILRPATVCGYAPRMRFDLTVNIITAHAVLKREITVFGGQQRRPNLHIKDMTRCYQLMLTAPAEKVAGQTFNVGQENLKVATIAERVAEIVSQMFGYRPGIVTTESTDKRSYHVNSDKIRDVLGFAPRYTVDDAIRDLCVKFQEGRFKDALTSPIYTNVKQLIDRGEPVSDSLAPYRKDRYAPA